MNNYNENNTSFFAQILDGNINYNVHYHDVGVGNNVVVMLHGSGPGASGWSNFNRNIEPLVSNGYRVILMDCPGWSKSDTVVCTESRSEFNARILKGLLNTLNIPIVSLIGNSMGGHSAVMFTLNYPESVNRIVLMGGGTGGISLFVPVPTEGIKLLQQVYREPNQQNLNNMMDIFVYDCKALTQELISSRLDNILSNTHHLENFIKSFQLNPQQFPDVTYKLNKIKSPTLIVWGRDDRFVPMDLGLRLLAHIEKSELHVFNKCGHWVQWEHADRFNALVLDFLTS